MTPNPPVVNEVVGEEALAEFRQGLTGPRAFTLLQEAAGRLLVQLPVGVGKTRWMREIIAHALSTGLADLVIVLVPRWDILKEIRDQLPRSLRPVILAPRPRRRCGTLDEQWETLERRACGCLGRLQLCGNCPRRKGCPWPGQYGAQLKGARLILGTQQHLTINPFFIEHLRQQTRATNPLVLIDESNLLIRPVERLVREADLQRFITAQEAVLSRNGSGARQSSQWLEQTRTLSLARTEDLRGGRWTFPVLDGQWAADVQLEGRTCFGDDFTFPGHDLHHFCHSDAYSRERLDNGDIRFAALPFLGNRFIIFTGSMAPTLARYRLDPNHARPALRSPFQGTRFRHPQTSWFNIRGLDGAARYFPGNAPRIIDFVARKILRNIAEGKRTLLVSRKKFVERCRCLLRDKLAALGETGIKIATGNWDRHDLESPRTIALINYGLAGVNRFEHVECAYCLNSYFITAASLSQAVQDLEPMAERYPITITMDRSAKRRAARVELPDARVPLLPRIAEETLVQKEADVVLQAVGRVRPFTRPREVITFHLGDLPGVDYVLDFPSLPQARSYFGLPTAAEAELLSNAERARRYRAEGFTVQRIADTLGISKSTAKRYLKRGVHPASS
jgi:hypothetical protein